MSEKIKTPRGSKKALNILSAGETLVREHSQSERAITKGGGFIYFAHPSGRTIPAIVGKWLIDSGFVAPSGDGLFPEISQTYQVSHG